jgi:hypothetical protein
MDVENLKKQERDAWADVVTCSTETARHRTWCTRHNRWVAAKAALDAAHTAVVTSEDRARVEANRQARNRTIDGAIAQMMRDKHGV